MEHDKRADEGKAQAADLEQRSDELERDIADVRDDWEAKKADAAISGAQPGDDDERQARQPGSDPEGPEVGRQDPEGAGSG